MKRIIFAIVIGIIFIAAIFYGGRLGQLTEIESTGSVMCLSCMGIE
jgi:hypothetical protein